MSRRRTGGIEIADTPLDLEGPHPPPILVTVGQVSGDVQIAELRCVTECTVGNGALAEDAGPRRPAII